MGIVMLILLNGKYKKSIKERELLRDLVIVTIFNLQKYGVARLIFYINSIVRKNWV